METKGSSKKACLILLFFAFFSLLSLRAQSQDNLDFSLKMYDSIEQKGFQVRKQNLDAANSGNFPQNLIVEIPSVRKSKNEIDTVVFSFTQDFFYKDMNLLLTFLDNLKGKNLNYDCIVFLSANDNALFVRGDEGREHHPTGSAVFTTSVRNSDNMCAIVIDESSSTSLSFFAKQTYSVIPGGSSDVSPSWLVKSLCDSCQENGASPSMPKSFSMLYRLDIARETRRVSQFFAQSIPAAGIALSATEKDLKILITAAELLQTRRSSIWDRHYSVFQIDAYTFWYGEALLALFFMIFAFATIFTVSFSSFKDTSKNKAIFKDIKRSAFLALGYIIIIVAVLVLMQTIFSFTARSPLVLMGIKVISVFMALVIIFITQLRKRFNTSLEGTGFFMMFQSSLNIFIFTWIDLSLFFMFFTEYVILALAKKTKTRINMIILFLVSLIPFLNLTIDFLKGANYLSLRRFAVCTVFGNILLALALLPLLMQIFRILMVLGIFNSKKKTSRKKNLVYATITTSIIILFFVSFYWMMIRIIYGPTSSTTFRARLSTVDGTNPEMVKISYTTNEFMELNIYHIVIDSDEKVLRYSISLEADGSIPLYDCNYDYTIEADNKVYFEIPDYPAGQIEIVYSSDKGLDQVLKISAFIQNSKNSAEVFHQKKEVNIRS